MGYIERMKAQLLEKDLAVFGVREDLLLAHSILNKGLYKKVSVCEYDQRKTINDSFAFTVGNVHVWPCGTFWQVAEKHGERYYDHWGGRGLSLHDIILKLTH